MKAARFFLILFLFLVSIQHIPGNPTAWGDPAPPDRGQRESAETIMQKARNLANAGRPQQALALLAPLVDKAESNPALYSDYIVMLFWAGRTAEALSRFEALPAGFARKPYLLRNMAKACLDQGEYDRAADLYQDVLRQTPEDLTALAGLVNSLTAAGRLDQAQAALENLPATPPAEPALVLAKGRLLLCEDRYLQSMAWFDSAILVHPAIAQPIAKARDDLFAALPRQKQQHMLDLLSQAARTGDTTARANTILLLSLGRRHTEAIAAYEKWRLNAADLPYDKLYRLAWSYYSANQPKMAELMFSIIVAHHPDHLPARVARITCYAARKRFSDAAAALKSLEAAHPENPEVAFAMANLNEKQGRFWDAIKVYDRILQWQPDNAVARRLRIRAWSDMGASLYAAQLARQEFPDDDLLRNGIAHDQAVNHLHWHEPEPAAAMLRHLSVKNPASGPAFDLISAQSQAQQHADAVAAYEKLTASGQKAPAWLQTAVADSYRAMHRPEQALDLYNHVLKTRPHDVDAGMGKFYTLQQLRRWQEAEALLLKMEAETPAAIIRGGKRQANPARLDLSVERGWLLANQNRLRQADAHFQALRSTAPADPDVRNGLAHVHLWRGWPRLALQDFQIIENMAPDYQPAHTGHIAALNGLAEKQTARRLAKLRLEQHPRDIHVHQIMRDLAVEQMNALRLALDAGREDDRTTDWMLHSELSTPLSLKTRLFGFVLKRHTFKDDRKKAEEEDFSADFKRAGAGIDHIFNSNLRLLQSLSINYDDGEDPGSYTLMEFTPDDHWRFGAFADFFSTDIPSRARATGIEADKFGADLTLRQSEWRQASIAYNHSRFSDGNDRGELLIDYQQYVWVQADFRMRLYVDLYATANSKGDRTNYFNPEHAASLSATWMAEQTVFEINRRSFVHRLLATLGNYWQDGFDGNWIGSLRYEADFEFSERHALQWGIAVGHSVYDGEGVDDIRTNAVYLWRF